MSYFVTVKGINGRRDWLHLATWFYERDLVADYHRTSPGILSHLRFDDEQTAIAFVLANGVDCPPFYCGLVTTELPIDTYYDEF